MASAQKTEDIKKRNPIVEILVYIILIFWALINLFPVYYMFTFALKDNDQILGGNIIGLPDPAVWENFSHALVTGDSRAASLPMAFVNSVLVSAITIAIVMIFSMMATFALTRFIWKGRKKMNDFFMLGLTIPAHVALIPIFIIISRMGIRNSFISLIVPYAAFSLAMAILICTGFMQDIPKELDEAACIDGCGTWGIFFKVIVPLMKPAVSTVSIYTFLQCWNEFLFASTYLSGAKATLPVFVSQFQGSFDTDWGKIGASLVLASLPALLFYVFFTKKIQASFISGAIKG